MWGPLPANLSEAFYAKAWAGFLVVMGAPLAYLYATTDEFSQPMVSLYFGLPHAMWRPCAVHALIDIERTSTGASAVPSRSAESSREAREHVCDLGLQPAELRSERGQEISVLDPHVMPLLLSA